MDRLEDLTTRTRLTGLKGVGVDVESDTKDIEGDLIYHGPVLKLALEF